MNFGFAIADFPLGKESAGKNLMHNTLRKRFLNSCSDNRKSKACPEPRRRIENLKWLGLSVFAFMFAVTGAAAEAQQTGKTFRIGFLDNSTASGIAVIVDTFRPELRKLGWIEGKNLAIEYRFGEEKPGRLAELAAELVRLKVDLILVGSVAAALAAKRATTTIPILMTNVGDPVGAGLVASLARPGGNVTGFSV